MQQQDQRIVRVDAAAQRFHNRRIRLQHGVADHAEHHQTEHLHHRIHDAFGVAQQEDADDEHGCDQRAYERWHAEDHIHREPGTANVTDVEGDPAQHDKGGYYVADAGQHAVCDVLTAEVGNRDDPPDVQLSTNVDQQRNDDGERKACQVFLGEQRRLRQKRGADRRRCHDKDGATQGISL